MADFLLTADGSAINAELIHTIHHENFHVYGKVAAGNDVVLLKARSLEECETYIKSVARLITYYPDAKDIEVKARMPIYEFIEQECMRGKDQLNKNNVKERFQFEYHWSLVYDIIEELKERGYLWDQEMGNFNVMAWPTYRAIQWMLNNLFYYYGDSYSRHESEVKDKLSTRGEANRLWPHYPKLHTNMLFQSMMDNGYFKPTEKMDGMITMKEPKYDYDENGEWKNYNVVIVKETMDKYDPKDFAEDTKQNDELEF